MHILVVDDDTHIQNFIKVQLESHGYKVTTSNNGREAMNALSQRPPIHLAIVDIMMPYVDGYELTHHLRESLNIPIIIISAKSQLNDKKQGFESGTDDYLVKPFEIDELLFRIDALKRRYQNNNDTTHIVIDNLRILPDDYLVEINQRTLKLPLKEFELLYMLAQSPNQVFTREQLIERIWGMDFIGDNRTVDVHIKRLRQRLSKFNTNILIDTVRGVGYRLSHS